MNFFDSNITEVEMTMKTRANDCNGVPSSIYSVQYLVYQNKNRICSNLKHEAANLVTVTFQQR